MHVRVLPFEDTVVREIVALNGGKATFDSNGECSGYVVLEPNDFVDTNELKLGARIAELVLGRNDSIWVLHKPFGKVVDSDSLVYSFELGFWEDTLDFASL